MRYKPKTICSAAFEDDLTRLKLLAQSEVSGGLLDDEDWTEEHEVEVDHFVQQACPSLQIIEAEEEEFPDDENSDTEGVETEKEKLRNLAHAIIRRAEIAKNINQKGKIDCGTSPVSLETYGVSFSVKENIPESGALGEGAAVCVNWKPCTRGPYIASPLHWAVLGRSHKCIEYLIANGASLASSLASSSSQFQFPTEVTPADIAKANMSKEVLRILTEAEEKRNVSLQKEEELIAEINQLMEDRLARRRQKREELERERVAAEEAEEDNED